MYMRIFLEEKKHKKKINPSEKKRDEKEGRKLYLKKYYFLGEIYPADIFFFICQIMYTISMCSIDLASVRSQ